MATRLFITGVTGYQGSTLLPLLLKQPDKYTISALVRSDAAANYLKSVDVTPIVGSLDDADTLRIAAMNADVVLNLADADHLEGAKALITGLKSKSGKPGIYIHSSGTSVLGDDAKGEYASDVIYNDLDIEKIHSLPPTQMHKDVDNWIFDNSEGVEAIIVCPPLIYGQATGPVKRQSVQIPTLVKAFLRKGGAATVGKGRNIWNNVHVEDLADFYVLLLEKAIAGEASSGKEGGWYFAENGEHSFHNLIVKIGEVLHEEGKIESPTVAEFTPDEVGEFLPGPFSWKTYGGNARCKADRARALGWAPKRGDVYEFVKGDVLSVLEALEKVGAT